MISTRGAVEASIRSYSVGSITTLTSSRNYRVDSKYSVYEDLNAALSEIGLEAIFILVGLALQTLPSASFGPQ